MIDIEEIFYGIKKALSNSIELVDDAEYLLQNNRLARAYSLFQLGIEEIGKVSMLYRFIIDYLTGETNDFKKIHKKLTDHKAKDIETVLYDLVILSYALDKDQYIDNEFFNMIKYEIQNIELINNYKNYSLYTSLIDNKFKAPKELITEDLVLSIRWRAQNRLALVKTIIDKHTSMDFKDFRQNLLELASKFDFKIEFDKALVKMNKLKKAYT
jgi:AbiV family abortive infection protein